MQNRLSAAKEQQTSLRAHVSDLQAAVEVEKQARPESVSRLSVYQLSCQLDGDPRIHATRRWRSSRH